MSEPPISGDLATGSSHPIIKQVKPGFTNYQPQPKYSWALSEIEGKGKLIKTKDLWKRSNKLKIWTSLKIWNFWKSEMFWMSEKNSENLKIFENRNILKIWKIIKFWQSLTLSQPHKFNSHSNNNKPSSNRMIMQAGSKRETNVPRRKRTWPSPWPSRKRLVKIPLLFGAWHTFDLGYTQGSRLGLAKKYYLQCVISHMCNVNVTQSKTGNLQTDNTDKEN